MVGPRQKNLVLILAREFASKLAIPTLLADADGTLVFFNEPAESVLGRRFADAGEMPAESWSSLFQVEDLEGRAVALEAMPAGVALTRREPAHGVLRIVGLDRVARTISVTALPLFAHRDDFVGVVVVFWQPDGREDA